MVIGGGLTAVLGSDWLWAGAFLPNTLNLLLRSSEFSPLKLLPGFSRSSEAVRPLFFEMACIAAIIACHEHRLIAELLINFKF